MSITREDMPWVIFQFAKEMFAVSVDNVREMVAMPKVAPVPKTPEYIRGVINLRGQVLPVLDLRVKMGMTSMLTESDDLIKLLNQREQDHKNWITELESSVHDHREFKLATDPHKCAFGKWYDHFEPDNRILESCLQKFDTPHKIIHSIAVKVKTLEAKGDFDGAIDVIEQTKQGELAQMIRLFEDARTCLRESNREIALVVEHAGKTLAVAVDSVETVERLAKSNVDALPGITSTASNVCIAGIGKREKTEQMVQLLDISELLRQEKNLPGMESEQEEAVAVEA